MAAKTATTKIYLDKRHESNDGAFYIKLRVTYQRKPKYYPTEIKMTEQGFRQVMSGNKKNTKEKEMFHRLTAFETKARDCIGKIPYFTFDQFEKHYISNRGATDKLETAYEVYINDLMAEERVGNANCYRTSFSSLNKFKNNLRFADVTPSLLRSYEAAMKSQGKSISTIGIYLRPLKSIFNIAIRQEIIDKSLFPFGKGKYEIPSGQNIKKALTSVQIANLFNYEAKCKNEQFAKDIWLFSYFCNGINMVDILNLKRKNIDGQHIYFIREKTKRSKRNIEPIKVHIKDEVWAIIDKYCVNSVEKEDYLFDVLTKKMGFEERGKKVKLFTKIINKYLKKIGTSIGVESKLTTYSARHSFATVLKRSGINTEFISESMGHSNIATTQKYLASFEDAAIKLNTDCLLIS